MKVLFLASEVAPFSKTGGLADVAGALPAALAELGHDVRVVSPRYPWIEAQKTVAQTDVVLPEGTFPATLLRPVDSGGTYQTWFLDQPHLFNRPGYYGDTDGNYADNPLRFAVFTKAALEGARAAKFVPDVVHLHDWQTGLGALFLKEVFPRASSVFTVHNLAYQGLYPKEWVSRLGLPWSEFTHEKLEFYDQLSLMKAGLCFSNALTTVSPTYAREIQTPEFGCGLEGLLSLRAKDLRGILNGIDDKAWDPSSDAHLPSNFSPAHLVGKDRCKQALLHRFGLRTDRPTAPLFVFVGRLVEQKGMEPLLKILPQLLQAGASVAFLATGIIEYEKALRQLRVEFPGQLGLHLGFDETLAHLFYAGGDFLLMPSRFEPCGLAQMYALRYGTLPIVHATGGLKDTVPDLSLPSGVGLTFFEFSATALWSAVQRALWLYRDGPALSALRRRGMILNFSWKLAAKQYEALYRSFAVGP